MGRMQIAIIDDLADDRAELVSYLKRYCEANCVELDIREFSDGESFLKEFETSVFQIVFLDIYLDGIDGMETARQIRERDQDCLLIFSTASDRHAVESFRVRAFHYLLKPYSYNRFEEVMRLCDKALLSRRHYIEVRVDRSMVRVLTRDILYADYSNHYIQLHTTSRVIRSHMYFDQLAQLLLIYPQFLYCYRNCIINMDWVASMDEWDFIMQNGERLPIMRKKRQEIRQRYADYAFERLERGELI